MFVDTWCDEANVAIQTLAIDPRALIAALL